MFVKRGKFLLPPPRKMSMGFTKMCVTDIMPSVFIIAHHTGVVKENFTPLVGGACIAIWGEKNRRPLVPLCKITKIIFIHKMNNYSLKAI